MNSFEEGGNCRGATNPSNDHLHGNGGPMTRSKIKRMKHALQGLILKIKEKEDECELRAASSWVTFLHIDEDALRPT
ncbi:hypothetical protein GmHk_04G010353 [Glycine max]|nr:hypothetical protein GmHk_04G010353 [Glycine max]